MESSSSFEADPEVLYLNGWRCYWPNSTLIDAKTGRVLVASPDWNSTSFRSSIRRDLSGAVAYWTKASLHGNENAMASLGFLYEAGEGVPMDFQIAQALFREAAMRGSASACCRLGRMYEIGHGLALDYECALTWYQKASDLGSRRAKTAIGRMYANGNGLPKDFSKAYQFYLSATSSPPGEFLADFNISILYTNGQGVPQCLVTALGWLEQGRKFRLLELGTYGAACSPTLGALERDSEMPSNEDCLSLHRHLRGRLNQDQIRQAHSYAEEIYKWRSRNRS